MGNRIFISYSSADLQQAQEVRKALIDDGLTAWFASEDLRVGDDWRAEIERMLRQSLVIVVLWSKNAAESRHVEREITQADDFKLGFLPVRLDGAPFSGPAGHILSNVQVVYRHVVGSLGLVRLVREYLQSVDVPYPFSQLYHSATATSPRLDFPRQLENLRLLIRFVALLHAARYLRSRHRTAELNGAVEKLLTLRSLFSDLDIGRRLASALEDRDGIDGSFQKFFQRTPGIVGAAEQFEKSGFAADDFDRMHLPLLLELTRPWGRRGMTPEHEADYYCAPIAAFIRSAVALPLFKVCRFVASIDRGGEPYAIDFDQPLPLSDEQMPRTDLHVRWASGVLNLSPFFQVVRKAGDRDADVGVLRWQDDRAHFSAFGESITEDHPAVALPWGRLEAVRTVPSIIYLGEAHRIAIRLTNAGQTPIEVSKLEERLPENLRSPAGERQIDLVSGLRLDVSASEELWYEVVGAGVPGGSRQFREDDAVRYRSGDEEGIAQIGGTRAVLVKTLPPPRVIVTRHVETLSGAPIGAEVPVDTDLRVAVSVSSGGAPLDHVSIDDLVEGAAVIGGGLRIHDGPLDRIDRQPPIIHTYGLRVSNRAQLSMRSAASVDGVSVEQTPSVAAIVPVSPPSLELSWVDVTPATPHSVDATLKLQNVGGARAFSIELAAELPPGMTVEVSTTQTGGLECLAPKDVQILWVRLRWTVTAPGTPQFTVSFRDGDGQPLSTTIVLALSTSLQVDLTRVPVIGRDSTREAIRAALTRRDRPVVCIHGSRGVGKLRILQDQVETLRSLRQRIELHDIPYHETLAGGLAGLVEAVMFEGAPPDDRSKDRMQAFLRDIRMEEGSTRAIFKRSKRFAGTRRPAHRRGSRSRCC